MEGFYTYLRDKILIKFGLEAYFVVLVWLFFFFFWLPMHAPAASFIGAFFIAIVPFVLPFLIWTLLHHAWFDYWWTKKYAATEYCVVEVRLPEELTQSPYAAELMLRGIYQTGEVDTPLHALWGNTRPWFSLEIASDEGQVHFYIWMRKRYKTLVESQIYAHYPSVQIVEVPDYTLAVPFDPAVVEVWGVEQALQKPDPYPILTYVELGMDKPSLKEENKFDPLAAVIESMGAIKKGEHVWMQIIIRAHTKGAPCPYAEETLHEKMDIEQWAAIETKKIQDKAIDPLTGRVNFMGLTEGDRKAMEAIGGKLNKQSFDVGMRTIYITTKEASSGATKTAIPSAMRSFEHGSEGRGLNGLRPVFWIGPFNYKWHDFMNIRRHMLWKRYYDAYVTRQFFYPPHKHRHIVLNTEEIATIYHFPGKVVQTPTLQRLPSKRAEAPSNLPV